MKREASDSIAPPPYLCLILQSVYVHSATAFSFPAAVPATQDMPVQSIDPATRQQLLLNLRDTLYSYCFARLYDGSKSVERGMPLAATNAADLLRKFAAANYGHDLWLTGWRVQEVGSEGTLVIANGNEQCLARIGEYAMTFCEDVAPRMGCAVTLCRRKESLTLQAGVYYAFGEALPQPEDASNVLRIYFHASQEAAIPIFEVMTTELNALRVPFTLKSMTRPQDQDRCDATVLYLPASGYSLLAGLIKKFSPALSSCLEPGVPLFTKCLHTGIGLAESPVTGESFGMHRCRLIATAIVAAWSESKQDVASRLQHIERQFLSEGISLTHPYLNPGSEDRYALPASL
jgi:hypothetical protein